MFRPGTILNDTWEVKRRIGQGSFCELFLAHNIVDKEAPLVAVKAQNDGIEASIIRVEGDVIRSLNDIPSVPKFYYYGQHKGIDYIVMELLGGEDMSKLRNRARAASHANLVALPVASFLSREILKSVKAIHERGYIHRDIKPANFVRRDKSSSEFCMVDFGLARQYRDRDGNIRPKREGCEFRGTALYASPFIHEGEEQCPRDDLFSLIFVFCDLVCGKLPWSESAKAKDKNKVASSKKQYLADPRRFVEWIKHQAEDADKLKRLTDGEPNFPPAAQEQCLVIIRHLQSLKYEDTPDYDLMDRAYQKASSNMDVEHNVSEISYSYGGFDWSGGLDMSKTWGAAAGPGEHGEKDYQQLQKILCARCRVLGKDIQKARRLLAAQALGAVRHVPSSVLSSSSSSAPGSGHGGDRNGRVKLEAAAVGGEVVKLEVESVTQSSATHTAVSISISDTMHAAVSRVGIADGSDLIGMGIGVDGVRAAVSPLELVSLDYDELATMLVDPNSPPPCSSSSARPSTHNGSSDGSSNGLGGFADSNLSDTLPANGSMTASDSNNIIASAVGHDRNRQGSVGTESVMKEGIKDIHIGGNAPRAAVPLSTAVEVSAVHTFVGTNMPSARCTDLSLGLLWQDIATQALGVPEHMVQRETLDLLDSLLRDAGRFFLCSLGEGEEHWDQFLELQNVAYSFAELLNRRNRATNRRDSTSYSSFSTPHTQSKNAVYSGRSNSLSGGPDTTKKPRTHF